MIGQNSDKTKTNHQCNKDLSSEGYLRSANAVFNPTIDIPKKALIMIMNIARLLEILIRRYEQLKWQYLGFLRNNS